jgi:hypothetical protein
MRQEAFELDMPPSELHAVKAEALREAIAAQSHYPCSCHDWAWRKGDWVLVARPHPGQSYAAERRKLAILK